MRVSQQAAYILHRYDYRETSLLLEIFSRNHGRLALVAKGARRQRRGLGSHIIPFQPLLLDWGGKGEVGVLYGAEQLQTYSRLQGRALYCGFYMNELLIKLLQRHDPHERLYDAYEEAIGALQHLDGLEATLRLFEKRLLDELGYGLILDHDVIDGTPISASRHYHYVLDRGPTRLTSCQVGHNEVRREDVVISGKTLSALRENRLLEDPVCLEEAKRLMRAALAVQLNGSKLKCRNLFTASAPPHQSPEHTTHD